jgi:hypothetical protein
VAGGANRHAIDEEQDRHPQRSLQSHRALEYFGCAISCPTITNTRPLFRALFLRFTAETDVIAAARFRYGFSARYIQININRLSDLTLFTTFMLYLFTV